MIDLFGRKARENNLYLRGLIIRNDDLLKECKNCILKQQSIIRDLEQENAFLRMQLNTFDEVTFPNTEGFLDGGI